MLKLDLEYNKGILFVRLTGDLTRMSSYKINNYLVPIILKNKLKYLVYNMDELQRVDDAGLDALLNTKYAIKINRGIIALCNVNKDLARQLNKTRIKIIDNELMVYNKVGA